MANTIKARRGTAAELAAMGALESGEFGKTTDTHQVFVGDGTANHEVVMHDEFSAQSILAAVTDNTPAALTVAEQTLVGRITAGNIDDLSATQVRTLLNVEDGATAGDAAAIHDNVAGEILAIAEDTTILGTHELLMENAAGTKKSGKISNLPVADMEKTSRTIYVNADAVNDTGDGSIGAPFQLYATALADVKNVIANDVTITIYLNAAAATYTAAATGRVCIGTGKLVIAGELTNAESATADSGDATTLTDTGAFVGDTWAGYLLEITGGTGSGQLRIIRTHTDNVLTVVSRFTTSPDNTSTYTIHGWGSNMTGTLILNQGTMRVQNIGLNIINVREGVSAQVHYSHFTATSTSSMLGQSNVVQFVGLYYCSLNAAGYSAAYVWLSYACQATLYASYMYGSIRNGMVLLWSGYITLAGGTYINGTAGAGVVVDVANALLFAWTSTVNGAIDVSTIIGDAGNTYGLYAHDGGGTQYCTGGTYVVFSGAFSVANSGANAATMGWIG